MDMDLSKPMNKMKDFWFGIGNFFSSRNVWIITAILLIIFLAVWGYFLFCDDKKKRMDETENKKYFISWILSCVLVLIGAIMIGACVSKLLLFFITFIFWALGIMVDLGAVVLVFGFCVLFVVVYFFIL